MQTNWSASNATTLITPWIGFDLKSLASAIRNGRHLSRYWTFISFGDWFIQLCIHNLNGHFGAFHKIIIFYCCKLVIKNRMLMIWVRSARKKFLKKITIPNLRHQQLHYCGHTEGRPKNESSTKVHSL